MKEWGAPFDNYPARHPEVFFGVDRIPLAQGGVYSRSIDKQTTAAPKIIENLVVVTLFAAKAVHG